MVQTSFGCIGLFGMHRLLGRIGTFGYTGIADIILLARAMRNRAADRGTPIGPVCIACVAPLIGAPGLRRAEAASAAQAGEGGLQQ